MNLENQIQQRFKTPAAGKYLKPYQGLKLGNLTQGCWHLRRKIPKTLSGIETMPADPAKSKSKAGKYLKPYQGLKQAKPIALVC